MDPTTGCQVTLGLQQGKGDPDGSQCVCIQHPTDIIPSQPWHGPYSSITCQAKKPCAR